MSNRNNNHPDNFNNNNGFRVSLAPDFRFCRQSCGSTERSEAKEGQRGPVPVACGLRITRPYIQTAPVFVVALSWSKGEAQAGAI